jgi:hypothetical protein
VHYFMGAWMGQRVIGGSLGEVLWVSRYGWMIGAVTALMCGVIQMLHLSSLFSATLSLVLLAIMMVILVLRFSRWLGPASINPMMMMKKGNQH